MTLPKILATTQSVNVQPGAHFASVPCVLSAPAMGPSYVSWYTMPGSAHESQDFAHSKGVVIFQEGQTVARAVVKLLPNSRHTGSISFAMHFAPACGVVGMGSAIVNLNARALVQAADLSAPGLAAATPSGLDRSGHPVARTLLTYGADTQSGEAGVYRPGLAKVGSDGRAHLTCASLPTPVVVGRKTYTTAMSMLLYENVFSRGCLWEHDMQVHEPTSGWFASWTGPNSGWPKTGEVDFPEIRPDWTPEGSLNLQQHYPGCQPGGSMGYPEPITALIPGFSYLQSHRYELEWTTDDVIAGRIDGVEVYRQPMGWDGTPHGVMLQCAAYKPLVAGKNPDVSWSYSRIWR